MNNGIVITVEEVDEELRESFQEETVYDHYFEAPAGYEWASTTILPHPSSLKLRVVITWTPSPAPPLQF